MFKNSMASTTVYADLLHFRNINLKQNIFQQDI